MALLKVSEFAEKYNIRRTNIYEYQKRGKLIIAEGYLDELNPINKIFIESREVSPNVKVKPSQKFENISVITEQTAEKTKKLTDDSQKKRRITAQSNDPILREFRETQKLRDEKLNQEIRLVRIRNDKMEGRLIPVDIAKRSMSEIISRYKMSFLQQTEQLIRDVLNECQAGNERITSACSRLTDIANSASKSAITETKFTIQSIIEETIGTK